MFIYKFVIFLLPLYMAVACGFVDSGGEGLNEPPVVVGEDLVVNEQTMVTLTSSVTDDFNDIASFNWVQVDNGAPKVSLTGADTKNATFIAPVVTVQQSPIQLSFMITVTDNFGEQVSDTVNVTVNAVNTEPVASSDSAVVDEGGKTIIDVIANDSDADGTIDGSTINIVSPATNGNLTMTAEGSVTYTHNGSETTADNFTYTVQDNETATSMEAMVSISITPVNDPPVAVNDTSDSTVEDSPTPVIVAVLTNDSDVDSTIDPSTVAITSSIKVTAVANPNGTVSFTPNPNASGTGSFKYTVRDVQGAVSNEATVTVPITPINDPPVAQNDTAATKQAQAVTINVLANDSDIDNDINPASVDIVTPPSNGAATVNSANGQVTYTPSTLFSGTDSFTYTVADIAGLRSNVATVSITVAANNPPVAVNDSGYSVNPLGALTVDAENGVLANDTDIDDDPLTAALVTNVTKGNLTLNSDGSFTYNYTGALLEDTDSFIYQANDGKAFSANGATATITISNSVPTANDAKLSINAQTDCWTTTQSQLLSGNLADPNAAPLTTYHLETNGTKGTVTILDAATGEFEYRPNPASARGVDTFRYRIDDPERGVSTKPVTIVIGPNIMPLGDSITAGITNATQRLPASSQRVGYRQWLYESLISSGFPVDFVGSQETGSGVSGFDAGNEAHGGWTAQELALGRGGAGDEGVFSWLDANPADIVLLHAGTQDLSTSPGQVGALLDEIDRWEASAKGNPVTVVLARIIDQTPSNPDVDVFNDQVEAMVQDRLSNSANPAFPDRLILVDQQRALTYPQDLADSLHPNAVGYSKMAKVWFEALVQSNMLYQCP